MRSSTVLDQRSEPRFRVLSPHEDLPIAENAPSPSVTVSLYEAEKPHPSLAKGSLLDLSRGGAKISIDAPISPDETVLVCIDFTEYGLTIKQPAHACWLRFSGDGTWHAGLSFAEELPHRVVPRLIEVGYIERREEDRIPIDLAGSVRDLSNTDRAHAVMLKDYSQGGVNLLAPERRSLHDPFILEIRSGNGELRQILCEAVWQKEHADSVRIGCRFLSSDAHQQVCDVVNRKEASEFTDVSTSSAWTFRHAVALVLALIMVYGLIVLLF